MHFKKAALALAFLLHPGLSVAKQPPLALLEKELDKIAQANISENGPGCTFDVIRDKQFLIQ